MANKLRISKQCIEVAFDIQDAPKLNKFYPVHYNRKKTIGTLSVRNIPEVLSVLRGIDETNADSLPESIKKIYHNEISARRRIDDLMANGPIATL